ncbi:hypothetical protein MTR67_052644 [Solanum verrucosum]|uniref:Tf2-1-like SH3-like domain-containing protein n=1 Tax=Solanum verrucosum TaxID=315347 RepID=A0AAF0V8B7_SOLVR|nr:hypothetical protein MTR67_052644 [Solanum verrucosum]
MAYEGYMQFVKKGKLGPRYVGPYNIIRRIGRMTYELDFSSKFKAVHPLFHVSRLYRCIENASDMPVEYICVSTNISYAKVFVAILDWQVRKIWTKEVVSIKVLGQNNNVEEIA